MAITYGRKLCLTVILAIYFLGLHTKPVTSKNRLEILNEQFVSDPELSSDDVYSSNQMDEGRHTSEEYTEEYKALKDKSDAELFALADGNNDGKLTLEEYLHFILNDFKPPRRFGLLETGRGVQLHLNEYFYDYDKDGNGYLTLNEVLYPSH